MSIIYVPQSVSPLLLQIPSKMKQLEQNNSQKRADILIKVVAKGESENQWYFSFCEERTKENKRRLRRHDEY